MSRPQRKSGALTADVLAVVRLTDQHPRKLGIGVETPDGTGGLSLTWEDWCLWTRTDMI